MIYSEYVQNGGTGIIKLLADNQTLEYLSSDYIQELDNDFLFENGVKLFSQSVGNLLKTKNDLTPLANIMKVRFGEKWKTLYNTIPKSSDPLASEVTKINGNIDINNQTTNQVAGYDDDAMVNDNSNQSKGSNTTNQTVTKTDYTEITELLDELKNNVFYDMLFNDIRNYMFLTLYGNERTF